MIMVQLVMAMAVHRPSKVFFQTVAVTVVFDHLCVFDQHVEDGRHMGRGRLDRPDKQRNAQDQRKRLRYFRLG